MKPAHQTACGSLPLRTGDKVHTLPHSGDDLVGRINAVYIGPPPTAPSLFYRVQFPPGVSPYFDDAGAVFRAHELEPHTDKPETIKVKLPKRPQPFHR